MENSLSRVVDAMPGLVWTAFPDGAIDFVNQGWCAYTGLAPDECRDQGWEVAIHPEDLPALVERWRSVVASGESGEMKARMRRFDGMYRCFLMRANPLTDARGRLLKWCGVNTDIEDIMPGAARDASRWWPSSAGGAIVDGSPATATTAHLDDRADALTARLRRSEAHLAEAQRLSLTGSFGWKLASDEHFWSDETFRIFEYDVSTRITLRSILDRIHPADIHLVEQAIAQAAGPRDFDYECRLLMPGGTVKYIHVVARGARNPAGAIEYIGAVQDVTERRVSEQALNKIRSDLAHIARITSLGAVTASIAHEVNQPLSGIITNASTCLRMLAAEPPNVAGARETARRAIRDGNRAADVIARLRALFAKQETVTEAVDLNEAAREVIALLTNELRQSEVMVQANLAGDLPLVTGDRVQLHHVILNLLLNAKDAMNAVEDRPRRLLIHTERDGDDHVFLAVRDTGTGFDPRSAERLFHAFYSTKSGGMGIGLSVCRSIIESHRGRLTAAPNAGPGATFWFSIPCGPETRAKVLDWDMMTDAPRAIGQS